jgi:hypothetical protein
VRDAFRAKGHDVWSCDLETTERPGLHYQGDVAHLLDGWVPVSFQAECDPDGDGWCSVTDSDPSDCPCIGSTQDDIEYTEHDGILFGRPVDSPHWDLMVAHPPCTYLSVSGLHWNGRVEGRAEKTESALALVRRLMDAPVKRICIENPVSCISSRIRKPDQIIQPYQFGHDASKATCLWLKGLPPLRPTKFIEPRIVNGKNRWANQTDSGQNKLGPSPTRAMDRAKTYQGIADAMAKQWG